MSEDKCQQADTPKKIPLEKFLPYVLQQVQFAKLDGILHYFNGTYFVPLASQTAVMKVFFQVFPNILALASLKTLSDCAKVIFQLHPFLDELPAEAYGYLGFANGICYYKIDANIPYPQFVFFRDNKHFLGYDEINKPTEPTGRLLDLFDEKDRAMYNESAAQLNTSPTQQSYAPVLDVPIKITHLLTAMWMTFPFDTPQVEARYGNYASYTIDPHIYAPITAHFFDVISDSDSDLVTRIWEMLACILVPDPTIKKFFLLYGVPDSGKSVLGNFIRSFFAKENVADLDFERLGDRFSTSSLSGAYLNLSMDLPNRPISTKTVAVLKQLTGDDDITVEAKFQDASSFKNRSRFLFATNHPLQLTQNDTAFLNRLVVIPFRKKVEDSAKDFDLLTKMSRERDIVASIAVRFFYPQIKGKNFVFSGSERADFQPTIKYSRNYKKGQEDQIFQFIMAQCRITGKKENFAYTEDIFKSYQDFCGKEGLDEPCDIKQFSRIFGDTVGSRVEKRRRHTSQNVGAEKIEKNQYAYEGIQLLTDPFTEFE